MGMFSWCCKGCGGELVMGEYVRLNGQKQDYDGYGGSATGMDEYDPAAWHERCYQKADSASKLDETPSKHAPDQGFGPAKLEFRRNYNPDKLTKYTAVVTGYYYREDEPGQRYTFHLTNADRLEDQEAYEKLYHAAEDAFCSSEFHKDFDYEAFSALPQDQKDQHHEAQIKMIEAKVGGPMPRRNEKIFDSIEAAIAAADAVLSRDLPAKLEGAYELTIFGSQGKADGCVYERIVQRRWDRSDSDYKNWKKLEGLDTEIRYELRN